jgi:hypothetical protein
VFPQVEYTAFTAFANTISADLLNRGGVSATYYAGAGFSNPVKATVAPTATTQKVQFKSSTPSANDFSIASLDAFSVRYAGQVLLAPSIAPQISHTLLASTLANTSFALKAAIAQLAPVFDGTYTFAWATAAAGTERVRLWVDNSLLIDQVPCGI